MSSGVRSRRLQSEIERAYEERTQQLLETARREVEIMHLDQTAPLVLAAIPQQRRWHQSAHGTHRPIGEVEHVRAVAREARHRVIDLRDRVVTSLELEPWKPLKRLTIDLDEVTAFALS